MLEKVIAFSLYFIPYAVLALDVVQISGTIKDPAGMFLPGANVQIMGTGFGSSSDGEGYYSFSVPLENIAGQPKLIQATYIGYKPSVDTLRFDGQEVLLLDFILSRDVLGLETVVVTGMGGIEEKKKLGVLIESVKTESVERSGETNIITALRGNVPGFEIKKTSGDAGTNAYFRIRGVGTISRSTEPLIVIDGIPINSRTTTVGSGVDLESPRNRSEASSRTSDINIDDIESIDVLKGAAASAIYGSRAANGVILITTKSGKTGKMSITYRSQFGISALNNDYPLQSWFGQGDGGDSIKNSSNSWGRPLNIPSAPWYNDNYPQDKIYDNFNSISDLGYSNEQNFSASGGTDRTNFYLSFGRSYERSHWISWSQYQDLVETTYGHDPTREIPSDYMRNSVRLKGSHLITPKLTISTSVSFVKVKTNNLSRGHTTDGLGRGLLSSPPDYDLTPYLNPTTQYHSSPTNTDPDVPEGPHSWNNPYWVLFEMKHGQDLNRTFGNVKLDYKPNTWSNLSYNFGADLTNDSRQDILPTGTYRDGGLGRTFQYQNNRTEWDSNLILSLDGQKLFKLPGKLTLGHNLNSRRSKTMKNLGEDQNVLNYYQMENYQSVSVFESISLIKSQSFFGQLTYDLADQFYLTAALRQDGSSTFGPSDREHIFRKFSGAWDFTKQFSIPYLDYGKVRFAWGEAGEQPGVYSIYSGYVSENIGYLQNKVSLGKSGVYHDVLGYVSDSRLGNAAIRPEIRSEYEYGLDMEIIGGRLGLSTTMYNATSRDVIFNLDVAPSTGSEVFTANGATIENKGMELTLSGIPVQRKDFTWSTRILFSKNDNMLLEMAGVSANDAKSLDPYSLELPVDQLSKFTFTAPGRTLGEFKGYSWARFGHGITATDKDSEGNTIYVNIDSLYAGQWKKNDVYVGIDGTPVLNWKFSDGSSRDYLWSGYSPNPDWTGSIYNQIKLSKNLSFSSLLDISYGGHIVNYTKNKLMELGTHKLTEERYHHMFDSTGWYGYLEGQTSEWGRGTFGNLLNNGSEAIGPGEDTGIKYDEEFYSSYMSTSQDIINNIEDASYIKLREVSLSYIIDHQKIKDKGFENITARLSFRDLVTWSKYTGWDPETNMMQNRISGEDYFNQPQTWGATFSLYLNW